MGLTGVDGREGATGARSLASPSRAVATGTVGVSTSPARRLTAHAPRRALAIGACLAIPVTTSAAAAQSNDEAVWSVVSIEMLADVTAGDGSADVSIRYLLSGTTPGAPLPLDRPVPVSLLGFGDATATRFSVDGGLSVDLRPAGGSLVTASVTPRDVGGGQRAGGEGEDVLPLTFTYRVERAIVESDGSLRARIPVLSGPSAPTATDGGGFRVRLIAPPGWRLSEPFPSGLRAVTEGDYEASLAVAPAFVGFRGRLDGGWRPDLPLLADLLTLAVLLGVLVIGSKHLRGLSA